MGMARVGAGAKEIAQPILFKRREASELVGLPDGILVLLVYLTRITQWSDISHFEMPNPNFILVFQRHLPHC